MNSCTGWIYRLSVLILLMALAGMGCMPKSMQVRTGLDPRYQDDDVRFRTVYYFRVFEYCENDTGNNEPHKNIEKDNLYRFLMTGKGSSIWNDIHFESGTLKKSEIDPFGALVTYNEDSRQFRYKSNDEIELLKRKEVLKYIDAEFRDLLKLKSTYSPGTTSKTKSKQKKNDKDTNPASGTEKAEGALQKNGEDAKPSTNTEEEPKNSVDSANSEDEKKNNLAKELNKFLIARAENITANFKQMTSTPSSSKSAALCSNQTPANREFWILGPEGWRKFDPDERLVLAMSSSGRPLISAMKELSGRVLNEKSATSDNEIQPLKEYLKASDALDKFQSLKDDAESKKVKDTIEEVLKILEGKDLAKKEGE